MTAKTIGVTLLLVLTATAQTDDKPTVPLNGGMTAQLLSLIHNFNGGRPVLTASVKITNTGKNYVFLMFDGAPSVIADTGANFEGTVSGVGWCRFASDRCLGIHDADNAFPLQQYTEIDPGRSVTAYVSMPIPARATLGNRVSLSAAIAYRLVSDIATEADLSNAQKVKQVRLGNLGFDAVTVTERSAGTQTTSPYVAPRPRFPPTPPPVFLPSKVNTPPQSSTLPPGGSALLRSFAAHPVIWGIFLVGLLALFIRDRTEYNESGEWNAFAPVLCCSVIVFGMWAWGFSGLLIVGPILIPILVWRWLAVERQRRQHADDLRKGQAPEPYSSRSQGAPHDRVKGSGLV